MVNWANVPIFMGKEHIKLLSKVNDSLSMKFLDSDNILGLILIY